MSENKKGKREMTLQELEQRIKTNQEKHPVYFKDLDKKEELRKRKVDSILSNAAQKKHEIVDLLKQANNRYGGEDSFYRFYHRSYKVYDIQELTICIVHFLVSLCDEFELKDVHPSFLEIFEQGTNRTFTKEHNIDWTSQTRPILEAFFHSKSFLELLLKYGLEMNETEREGLSGWASVLYFYQLR